MFISKSLDLSLLRKQLVEKRDAIWRKNKADDNRQFKRYWMGHNAGKNWYRDDETGGSAETRSGMESKKTLTARPFELQMSISE
jgi:hypothetical protein